MNAMHPIFAQALTPFIDMTAPQRAPTSLDMPRADIAIQFELTADGPGGKHWLADLSATVTVYRGTQGWEAETVTLHACDPVTLKPSTYEVDVSRHAAGHHIAELAVVELMQPRHAARVEEALAKAEREQRAVA